MKYEQKDIIRMVLLGMFDRIDSIFPDYQDIPTDIALTNYIHGVKETALSTFQILSEGEIFMTDIDDIISPYVEEFIDNGGGYLDNEKLEELIEKVVDYIDDASEV